MSSRFLVVSSLWLVFFVNGAVLSSWAPRIPEVKDRLALSDSEFGLALLGIALGSVPAMLLITCLLRRVSDIAVCSSATLLFPTALLLRRDFHADPALAASVLSMFSIAMFISRSISDTIMHRVRERTFLLFTAIIIALAIPATCATGSVPLVMVGIVVTGFFVGPLFPLALARGGRAAPQHLAEVAAALSIIGYAAHLGGPPLIGFAAEHTSLTFTVAAAVVIVAVVLVSVRKTPETETA